MQRLPDVRPEFLQLVRDGIPHRLRAPSRERVRNGALARWIVQIGDVRDDERAANLGEIELRMTGSRLCHRAAAGGVIETVEESGRAPLIVARILFEQR